MPRREKEAAVTSLIPLSHKSLAPTQNTALRFLIRHTSSNLSLNEGKKNPTQKPIFVWVKACGALFAASPFFTPLPSYAHFTLTAVHRPVNSYEDEYLLAVGLVGAPQLGTCVAGLEIKTAFDRLIVSITQANRRSRCNPLQASYL